ncbi:DUF1972 domain-containing protein [Shewanella zhangzhouensis]|uniref:DUF1972 domain-containing protein n=1 Tax=Shewanella zhangzhouensis TaxID=2864213 RepID=UPI0021ACA015|nr:DUF1972 domain-containing protein [Shewanella zhangzhouensis]
MKVAVVGTVGIPACYGGFESLVENITLNHSAGVDYTVFCSEHGYSEKLSKHNDAELIYLPLHANGVQSIFYDIASLIKCLYLKPDVTLVLGVSGCTFLPFYKLLSKSKVITNIDGLEWRRDKWNWFARKFLKLSERLAVNFSDVVVSDNQAITDYVFSEYGKTASTIAYGGDHALRQNASFFDGNGSSSMYALALCRIEPENNVEMILNAFSKSNTKIKFVGNWNSSDFGRNTRSKYSSFENIELIDPIYDLDKLFELRSGCSFYVHGHSAGGTNPSLVEMMHFGLPIFAFDCSFNRFSTEDRAFYFSSVEELVFLITDYPSDKYKCSGEFMKDIASKRYAWKIIAADYERLY